MPKKKPLTEGMYIPPHMRRREPREKKKAGTLPPGFTKKARDKFGRWKPGHRFTATPNLTVANSDLAELITSKANLKRLADSVLKRAYDGDGSAQATVLKLIDEKRKAMNPADRYNYHLLSDEETKVLKGLMEKAMGRIPQDRQVLPVPTPISIEDELDEIVSRTRGSDRETDPNEDDQDDDEVATGSRRDPANVRPDRG